MFHLGDLYAESGQNLHGSFSAVSKPNFATKYAFESSRRDLHNALLRTALKSHFFVKIARILPNFAKIFRKFIQFADFAKFWQILTKKMRLQSCAKECIV